eukprot:jgi/Mesvir1/26175/Mv06872-RA.1
MAEAVAPLKLTSEMLASASKDLGAYTGALDLDLGNLLASDPSDLHVPATASPEEVEEHCRGHARDIVQALIQGLFSCPSRKVDMGRMAQLPAPTFALPRVKPLPKPKPLTKWEKFAKEKGIRKKKKDKVVWDDATGEWRRRYGYKRAGDISDVGVIEAKPTDQVGEDPFEKLEKKKKSNVAKNEANRIRNVRAAAKATGGKKASFGGGDADGSIPSPSSATLATSRGLQRVSDGGKAGVGGVRRPNKRQLEDAVATAAGSTASMGRFDEKLEGEKPAKARGKKKKNFPLADPGERDRVREMALKLIAQQGDELVDMKKAVNMQQFINDQRRAAEKQNGGGAGVGGKHSGGKKRKGHGAPDGKKMRTK